jgi:hypothetical protein
MAADSTPARLARQWRSRSIEQHPNQQRRDQQRRASDFSPAGQPLVLPENNTIDKFVLPFIMTLIFALKPEAPAPLASSKEHP